VAAGVLVLDDLPARVVGGVNGFGCGDLGCELGDAFGRGAAAEAAMRAAVVVVVVEGSPPLELGLKARALGIDRGPELLNGGALDTREAIGPLARSHGRDVSAASMMGRWRQVVLIIVHQLGAVSGGGGRGADQICAVPPPRSR
jgi:hypothetical protein